MSGVVMLDSGIPVKEYELFGGAIRCTLPADLIDASDFRQVPDTQEVLLSKDSNISFIIEILQRVDPGDAVEAAKFHFDALAHDNSATSCTVDEVFAPQAVSGPSPPFQPMRASIIGTQTVPKFNKGAQHADRVKILLTVWRVDTKNMDVVLSVNVPVITGTDNNLTGVGDAGYNWAKATWECAQSTFTIVDFALFA
ncbi:hypothetical protein FRB99_006110 [Tulasnella sp. 403]|nr:hypothetical protein FRB99_006110 [Tulasnella sp. 403]